MGSGSVRRDGVCLEDADPGHALLVRDKVEAGRHQSEFEATEAWPRAAYRTCTITALLGCVLPPLQTSSLPSSSPRLARSLLTLTLTQTR